MARKPAAKTRTRVTKRSVRPHPARPRADHVPVDPPTDPVDWLPDAVIILNAARRCIFVNPAACKLLERERKDLLADPQPTASRPLAAVIQSETFQRLRSAPLTEGEVVLRAGSSRETTVDIRGVRLDDGSVVLSARDVTAAARERAETLRSLNSFVTLVDLCHAGVISAGTDGLIRSWNPTAEQLFGYSAKEALGMPIDLLVPPELRDAHRSMFLQHVRNRPDRPHARVLTTEALRKNGDRFPVEISLAVGPREDTTLFTAVLRDLSEHQAVVEKLNDALQRLRFHFERMPLVYVVWDSDFRVVEWNATAERIFGFTRDEAVGKHAYDLIVPPDVVETIRPIWADLLRGSTSSHSINDNLRKDGSRIACEWFNTALTDSSGNIHGVASMAWDVSEREVLEARLRDAQRVESLGVLASGVAHDFNSSLMVILGNAALLRSIKKLPPNAIEHLELIEEAGARANNLIKHLLAYARTGRHNPQPTHLNALVNDSLTFLRSTLGAAHSLQLQLAEGLPPILADRSQLEQILVNFCLNAKQAMPKGGVVTIRTLTRILRPEDVARSVMVHARPGSYAGFSVTDTGCGMDSATLSRIWDPFFTTKSQGHGLGLAAVLGILRQHNATAIVETDPRRGTTMHAYFPVPVS
ncbi:MAG: PAS domain S-box protein [Planctomycetota bacterium]